MRILVVEDDPLTRQGIAAHLRAERFVVAECSGGEEAGERARAWKPDLVCLDIMMPGVDGYEVCRRLRARNPSLPIILISAKNEEVDVVVGLELGADDFIRKPFGRRELLARIRAVIRRTGSQRDLAKL